MLNIDWDSILVQNMARRWGLPKGQGTRANEAGGGGGISGLDLLVSPRDLRLIT